MRRKSIRGEFLMQRKLRDMVMRKGIHLAAIVGTTLWLLLFLSGFSSLGGQQQQSHGNHDHRDDLVGRITKFFRRGMPAAQVPLEMLTEIPQSAAEVPGSELPLHGAHYPSILILSPLKKVSNHIDRYFTLLHALSYPKNAISLGFLVSDSHDGSYARVRNHFLTRKHTVTNPKEKYRDVMLVQQDMGYDPGENWLDVRGLRNQIPRRKVLAKSRNYLLLSALRPHHDWVLWIDSDVSHYPPTLISDLLRFTSPEHHILVPNSFWRDENGEEHPYDRNSWRETSASRAFLRETREVVVFEGYAAYSTGRVSLGEMRGGNESVVKLDGVGGTVLLVRARLHREGLLFMPVPYEKAIETEALGKLALEMGYQPWGLPNYITLH